MVNLQCAVMFTILLCALAVNTDTSGAWEKLQLPAEHIPYYFTNNPDLKIKCSEDDQCPYKDFLDESKCWGYESNCPKKNRMSVPRCPGDSRGWAQTKDSQLDAFWTQGDFGYIKERKEEMMILCKPKNKDDSSLKCIKFLRYCEATNLYMDFKNLKAETSRDRYREDVFKPGDIGGHCKLNSKMLKAQSEHKSPLQSWFAELESYTSLKTNPVSEDNCDVVLKKPTFLIKLDAGINMYHHFCDFINLYASQHMNNSFNTDINIVMWDTSPMHYGDFFADTWKAFTDHPIIHLKDFDGKKVCIKQAVFPLLARMRFGLYYNMPLIPGCHGSSLFRAFSQHVLHRLNVTQEGPLENKIRITLLSRNTKYRNILNQNELVSAMKTVSEYEVRVVDYNWNMPFLEQLQITHNSDVFLGMHGAGLTHMMFQPNWAVGFEIYNCEDEGCYSDLARLRGIKYMTWNGKYKLHQEDEGHHPTLGAHAKFTNYAFDVEEFMKRIDEAVEHVRNHAAFKNARKQKYNQSPKDEL